MATLKYLRLSVLVLLFYNCDEYNNNDDSFSGIYLNDWNSSVCPKKIIFEKYVKKSNFKSLIECSSDFDIECNIKYDKFNNKIITPKSKEDRLLTPYVSYKGIINYDVRLVINDSLEFKITDIKTKKHTNVRSFSISKKHYTSNILNSIVVNGYKLNNDSRDFLIPTKLGKVIKK